LKFLLILLLAAKSARIPQGAKPTSLKKLINKAKPHATNQTRSLKPLKSLFCYKGDYFIIILVKNLKLYSGFVKFIISLRWERKVREIKKKNSPE